jgi:hypothetical protein
LKIGLEENERTQILNAISTVEKERKREERSFWVKGKRFSSFLKKVSSPLSSL